MFDGILSRLIERIPGARGAVFCDGLGETVQSVGASGRHDPAHRDDFDLRVAGAQLATPLELARESGEANVGALRELVIGGGRETLLVHLLPDGYYLVVCLEPGAIVSVAMHHLREVAREVAKEI